MRNDDRYDSPTRDRDFESRDRDRSDRRERGAFFSADEDRERHARRYGEDYRETGGWAGLMPDHSERDRERGHRGREGRRGGGRFGRRDPQFGGDAYREGLPREETGRLIASNKVEGTPVYDRNEERIGSIHNFMVDKFSGRVVYAVLKHGGGFLGIGERYYPLHWDELTYDRDVEGYAVDFTEDELDDRRSFDMHGRENMSSRDRSYGDRSGERSRYRR